MDIEFGRNARKGGKPPRSIQRPFRSTEDLAGMSDREIGVLMGELDQADASVAILEMSPELRDRFFHAMEENEREAIRKAWKAMKPVEPARAEEIRARVLAAANKVSPGA
jgi:flagellar motor switch protein FliG